MLSKTIILSTITFAILNFTPQIFCDTTKGFFYPQQVGPNQNSPSPIPNHGEVNNNIDHNQLQQQQEPLHQAYLESFPVTTFADRSFPFSFPTALWNPFQYFNMDSLVQPAVTAIGLVVGLYGFSQITEWLFEIIAAAKSKDKVEPIALPKAEDTNEVEDARKKRTISLEETRHIIESIEAAEKSFQI